MSQKASPANLQRQLDQLKAENQSLRLRLEEAEQTLEAIRSGAVDALVIDTPEGERVFSLQSAERPYRTLIERMQEGAVTLIRDGTIQYCNQAFAAMLKRPLEEVLGSQIEQHIHEPDRPDVAAKLQHCQAGGARGEVCLCAADCSLVPVHVGLTLLVEDGQGSICMVVTNLTERKRAQAVMASEQFVRRLIESAPMGIAVVGRDMRYILANPAYRDITGGETLAGRSIAEVFPPAVAQIVQSALAQALKSGQPVAFRGYETPIRGQSWWNVDEIPLLDAAGQVEAVLLLTQEVTEQKRAETALRRSNEQLAAANEELHVASEELAAQNRALLESQKQLHAAKHSAEQAKAAAEHASKVKDHFLAVLSHELRNPLNPVLATASMLQADPRFDSDTLEHVEIIRRNAELEAQLIDDLLDVTRIERGKVELNRRPVELSIIIDRTVEVCRHDIEARKLEFGADLGPDAPYVVDADAARLQQILWNLLNNAIKFTPAGGCVGIRCRKDAENHVIAEVHDSGEGIDPTVLPRLFSAFEQGGRQTTRQFGGLGLGLTISKAMADLHGGTLTAYSAGKGKGATFMLRLPLLPKGTAAAAAPAAPQAVPLDSAGALRILLVEDHVDTAKIMRKLLSAQGHKVQIAADVATALNLATQQQFDLMLSDLGLPDGSGLDLMRAIRAKGITLRGIALSGYGQDQDVQQSREAGFSEHIVKPVSLAKLDEAIARTMGHATRRRGKKKM